MHINHCSVQKYFRCRWFQLISDKSLLLLFYLLDFPRQVCSDSLCHHGDDMKEFSRLCKWEDSIEMDLKEIDFVVVNCMKLAQDRDHRGAPG